MHFFNFHGHYEIYLFLNRIDVIIIYQKIVMQKLYLMRKQKYGPWKMAKIWVKIPEKGKNQIKSTLKILKLLCKLSQSCLRDTSEMFLLRCLINASVRQCLFLQESCLLDILKTSQQDVLQDLKFMTFAYAFECSKV